MNLLKGSYAPEDKVTSGHHCGFRATACPMKFLFRCTWGLLVYNTDHFRHLTYKNTLLSLTCFVYIPLDCFAVKQNLRKGWYFVTELCFVFDCGLKLLMSNSYKKRAKKGGGRGWIKRYNRERTNFLGDVMINDATP